MQTSFSVVIRLEGIDVTGRHEDKLFQVLNLGLLPLLLRNLKCYSTSDLKHVYSSHASSFLFIFCIKFSLQSILSMKVAWYNRISIIRNHHNYFHPLLSKYQSFLLFPSPFDDIKGAWKGPRFPIRILNMKKNQLFSIFLNCYSP